MDAHHRVRLWWSDLVSFRPKTQRSVPLASCVLTVDWGHSLLGSNQRARQGYLLTSRGPRSTPLCPVCEPVSSLAQCILHTMWWHKYSSKKTIQQPRRTSLAVQRWTLCTSTASDVGSTPGWGTRIPHALRHGKKKKNSKKWSNLNITFIM